MRDDADWDARLPELSKSLPTLPTIDHHLRCRICKDYLVAPLITSCGHTFCSLCIRRALAAEAHCPACRSREEEFKLKKNVLAEELVEAYEPLRRSLMDLQQAHQLQEEKHRRAIVNGDHDASLQSDVRRRSKRRRTSQPCSVASSPECVTHSPALEQGEVLCPVCSKPVQEDGINAHMDRCLSGEANGDTAEATYSKHFAPQTTPSVAARAPEKRLPKLNYSVLTESKLRTELSRLGIPTYGSKTVLQRRHAEWLTLWNSNMDAKHPRSRRDLLRELKVWEDALGRSTVKLTTEELEERAADDRDDFKQLVARARASAEEAKRKSLEAAQEETASAAIDSPVPQET